MNINMVTDKLYHGRISIGYETSFGTIGSFEHGCRFFAGSEGDIITQHSELIAELIAEYKRLGPSHNQTSDRNETYTKVTPSISLTEVSVPGFKISLERVVESKTH